MLPSNQFRGCVHWVEIEGIGNIPVVLPIKCPPRRRDKVLVSSLNGIAPRVEIQRYLLHHVYHNVFRKGSPQRSLDFLDRPSTGGSKVRHLTPRMDAGISPPRPTHRAPFLQEMTP